MAPKCPNGVIIPPWGPTGRLLTLPGPVASVPWRCRITPLVRFWRCGGRRKGTRMEIGLYAESAGLSSLNETLPRARNLGITRIELATGGQNPRPFLDVERLLESQPARRELLQQLADHGMTLSALNVSAFPLHPRLGRDHTDLTRATMRLAGELGVDRIVAQSGVPGDAPGSTVPNWVVYPWPDDMRDT